MHSSYGVGDHDIIYATSRSMHGELTGVKQSAEPRGVPDPETQGPSESVPCASGRPVGFVRRGQGIGDIGWGCYQLNTCESAANGVRE